MARSRKRGHGQKAHGLKAGERFAMVPERVIRSEAFTSLTAAGLRLLMLAACDYHGSNNGTIVITKAKMRTYGFESNDTLTRAIQQLIDCGLLVRTRQGGLSQGKSNPSLYALGWLDIPENPDLDIKTPAGPTFRPCTPHTDLSGREPPDDDPSTKNGRTDPPGRARTDSCGPLAPIPADSDDSRTDPPGRARTDLSGTFLRSSPEGHPPPHEVQVSGDLPPSSRIDSAPGQGNASGDPGDTQVDGSCDRRGPLSLVNHPTAPVIPIRRKT